MTTLASRLPKFYLKLSFFSFRERFSDLSSGWVGLLLYPFFIWLLGRIWLRFNVAGSVYSHEEVKTYIAVAELLFMTFLRDPLAARASGDFSISLARPRSWPAMTMAQGFGICFGDRLIYLVVALVGLPLLGVQPLLAAQSSLRCLVFLIPLGLVQAQMNLLFASARILWDQVSYFRLPISKIFLALGGVFGPLADYREPYRHWVLAFPPSDLFFQVSHFCVKGEFFMLSAGMWIVRYLVFVGVLSITNFWLYRRARRFHQSYGG